MEHSRTYDNDEENFAAAHAIDLNLDTLSLTSAGSNGKSWLKIKLSQVHCVQQVIWYSSNGNPFLTWTCSQTDCACSEQCDYFGCFCKWHTLTVSSEKTAPNKPTPGCKYGDTVTVERNSGRWFDVYEIAITGQQGK